MVFSRSRSLLALLLAALSAATAAACGAMPDGGATPDINDQDEITSATGVERRITWEGFVYVAPDADTQTIQRAVQRQVKSAIGALRQPEIGLQDREALTAVDPASFRREPLVAVDTANPSAPPVALHRVRYRYSDVAIVRRGRATRAIQLPLLFGDYVARAGRITPACSDDPAASPDSLWYHFAPQQSRCVTAMRVETAAINDAARRLRDGRTQISRVDFDRLYLTVRADITAVMAAPVTYPEYDRLWGFGTSRTQLVVYAFFGVDADLRDSRDVSLIEYMRFLRTLRARFPRLAVTETRPHASLLDFDVAGRRVTARYEDVFTWVIDNTGFPAEVGADAGRREALKQQVIDRFAERWIYWSLPVRVTRGAESRDMTVQVRAYWGYEDGRPEWRQAARWRYLEGFWHGDVFLYQGHSHFGHGPLEPTGYNTSHFPSDRYQTMLVNSCLSFNYYDVDFLAMHPSGSQNLDVVVNGLPAYWTKLGEASANYVAGLIDGQNRSWQQVLEGMIVRPSWAPAGYDPLRAVNGELDNRFRPDNGNGVSVTVR